MNIGLWLAQTARDTPDRPALFLGKDQVADYAAFDSRALKLAGWLRAQGVAPDDRVAIFMKNCPDFLICLYAIWYLGAAAVPINAKLHSREAAHIIADSGSKMVFVSPDLSQGLTDAGVICPVIERGSSVFDDACADSAVRDIEPRAQSDLAWLFYTSGTTGKPKGVMITHGMLVAMSQAYEVDVEPVRPDDAVLYAAPMSHGAGLYNMLHVRRGARHVCPASAGFDPSEIFDLAAHFEDVQMFAAPTMVRRMTEAAKQNSATGQGLKTIVYAGGPMYLADIIEAVDHFGPRFAQIYGQGECPMAITALSRADVSDRAHPRWRERLMSVGVAQSCVEVRIADDDGTQLAPGEMGEIVVRGKTVMPGYWRNDAATAEAIQNGWLRTGDIGSMDADGYVTLLDRSKDMIISGGSNIYPREVEEVLLTHPLVREVSVVGRTHPDWGEEVIAFVVGSAAPADLNRLCQDTIARFKRPKDYVFVPDLPKNNYGKVLKTELRKRLDHT
jgi:long-chain acyl-CoA synthetase